MEQQSHFLRKSESSSQWCMARTAEGAERRGSEEQGIRKASGRRNVNREGNESKEGNEEGSGEDYNGGARVSS